MSTHNSNDTEEQSNVLQGNFQKLQAAVVSGRNAVIILRSSAVIALRRHRQTKAQLKKDEAELTRLHKLLHPDEQ